jgi:hypothetical protein
MGWSQPALPHRHATDMITGCYGVSIPSERRAFMTDSGAIITESWRS